MFTRATSQKIPDVIQCSKRTILSIGIKSSFSDHVSSLFGLLASLLSPVVTRWPLVAMTPRRLTANHHVPSPSSGTSATPPSYGSIYKTDGNHASPEGGE